MRPRKAEVREAESPSPSSRPREGALQRLRRKAGCILGLFTEPLVLLGVTLLAVVFGRAYLTRRAERLRARHLEDKQDD